MATRVCPNCKAQYVASVRRCIDCDLVLVDEERPESPKAASDEPRADGGDHVGFELEGWGNQLKVALEGMLDRAGIPRAWESGALVVPAVYEDEVERLITTFEGAEVGELPDEDEDQVAFEFQGLTADELSDLDARLLAGQIAHAWDDDANLLVAASDEDLVAAIIDEVMSAPPEDEGDGLATQAALSELYVAIDKLQKDVEDHKLIGRYVDAADALEGLPVPYGLTGDDWRSLVEEVLSIAEGLAPTDGDDPDEGSDDADGADADADTDTDTDTDGTDTDTDDDDAVRSLTERVRDLRVRLADLV